MISLHLWRLGNGSGDCTLAKAHVGLSASHEVKYTRRMMRVCFLMFGRAVAMQTP